MMLRFSGSPLTLQRRLCSTCQGHLSSNAPAKYGCVAAGQQGFLLHPPRGYSLSLLCRHRVSILSDFGSAKPPSVPLPTLGGGQSAWLGKELEGRVPTCLELLLARSYSGPFPSCFASAGREPEVVQSRGLTLALDWTYLSLN